ncbi:MFS transporter [Haliovirga abyssi]|uniref:MFS transporter n=1 Tax=Haliovirga abyssi TaxID=2996794 RepID=A0AAU9D9M7_9FUSO|nr:MFS transporter [Haliovirga abyssi]BDU51333.1 MFS transporter [Haliovirga abyssi]
MQFINLSGNKNKILLLLGKIISLFGTNIFNFALSYYILKITGSPLSFGLSLIVTYLPRIFFSSIIGTLVDRINKRWMLAISDFLSFFILSFFYFTVNLFGVKIEFIYITMFLLSTTSIFFNILFDSSLKELISNNEIKELYSLNETINSLTYILSPLIGGVIYYIVDIKIFIFINGISFLLSGISELFLRYNKIVSNLEKKKDKFFSELILGFADIKNDKKILTLFLSFVLFNFFFNFGYLIPVPYIIINLKGYSSVEFGILRTFFSIGALFGSIIVNKKKLKVEYPYKSTILMAFFLLVIGVITIVNIKAKILVFSLFLIDMFFFGLFMIISNIKLMILFQDIIPDNKKGKILGVITMGGSILSPLAVYLSSSIIEKYAINFLPLISGMVLIVSVVIFMIKWEKIENRKISELENENAMN